MHMINDNRRDQGFTLMEMLVVMAGGLVLLAVTMGVFTDAMKSVMYATDRAELQQNIRAALNYITHDVVMAGSQMPQFGINVGGSKYSCAKGEKGNGCGMYSFPKDANGNPVLYAVMPNPSAKGLTDAIGLAYPDPSLAQCPIQNSNPSAVQVTLGSCMIDGTVPAGYYSYNDPGYGLNEGDIMLFSAPGISEYAVGVVTKKDEKGIVHFAANDALNLNQPSASKGNLATFLSDAAGHDVTASRLLLITYYLEKASGSDGKSGTFDDSYRLMRQVNAQPAIPVAEDIASLQLTYDTFDSAGGGSAGTRNANNRPDLVRKVNIGIEAKSLPRKTVSKTQYMRLATSVEPRNLVYHNTYEFKKEK